MDITTFHSACDFVLKHTRQSRVHWVFHGGEPLIMGWRWLRDSMGYARDAAHRCGVTIKFGLVTNGTLLNQDLASLFKDEEVLICVSLDGPPEINDIFRASGGKTLKGIDYLRQKDVRFRVLGLIHAANWNKMHRVVEFFISEGIQHTKFNLCYRTGRGLYGSELKADQAFAARKTLLSYMNEGPDTFTEVNLVHQLLRYFDVHPPYCDAGCSTMICGAGMGYLGIQYDGSLFPCGRAADLGPEWKFGVVRQPISSGALSTCLAAFHAAGSRAECYSCDASLLCDYICPANRIAHEGNRRLHCGVSRLLLDHLNGLDRQEKAMLRTSIVRANIGIPEELGIPGALHLNKK